MACSNPMDVPVFQGQSVMQCQFCEVDHEIQYKCVECDLLLCTRCKDKIHSKVKTAEEHRIINIKETGLTSDKDTVQSGSTCPLKTSSDFNIVQSANLELSVVKEHSTKFRVGFIQASLDDSLWIGSQGRKKDNFFSFESVRHLQKVKLKRNNLKIMSSFNLDVYDIAVTPSSHLLIADYTPKLKQILQKSSKVTESNYCIEPFVASSVHVTRKNKVVVGARFKGEGAVFIMDINGIHEHIYKFNNVNAPLLTIPQRITSTSTGTICVIDIISRDPLEGRLVLLRDEEVLGTYKGHPNINSGRLFIPAGVVSTSNDNIIVTDPFNNILHILNKTGSFITYYDTQKLGIQNPFSLSFSIVGQFSILYIGCWPDADNGKFYKLTLSGC